MVGTRLGPQAASRTVWVTGPHSMPCSVPVTRQPYGANQSTGVPATTLEAGPRVDAEVVPVDHEDQVVQAQAPRRVLGLVGRTRGEPALALEHEDLDLARARQLQGERLARGRRHAVPGRTGVELQEERPALHLG